MIAAFTIEHDWTKQFKRIFTQKKTLKVKQTCEGQTKKRNESPNFQSSSLEPWKPMGETYLTPTGGIGWLSWNRRPTQVRLEAPGWWSLVFGSPDQIKKKHRSCGRRWCVCCETLEVDMFKFANQNDYIMVCLYCYSPNLQKFFGRLNENKCIKAINTLQIIKKKTRNFIKPEKTAINVTDSCYWTIDLWGLIVKKTMVENHGNQKRNCEVQLWRPGFSKNNMRSSIKMIWKKASLCTVHLTTQVSDAACFLNCRSTVEVWRSKFSSWIRHHIRLKVWNRQQQTTIKHQGWQNQVAIRRIWTVTS